MHNCRCQNLNPSLGPHASKTPKFSMTLNRVASENFLFHVVVSYEHCGRQNNDPKDVHTLIPGACECPFVWQKDTGNVVRLRTLGSEISMDYTAKPTVIKVGIRRAREGVMVEAQVE